MQATTSYGWRLVASFPPRTIPICCAPLPVCALHLLKRNSGLPAKQMLRKQRRIREISQERIGISDSVHWLGLRDDMPALLDAADAFVLSSAWEGMPLARRRSDGHGETGRCHRRWRSPRTRRRCRRPRSAEKFRCAGRRNAPRHAHAPGSAGRIWAKLRANEFASTST